MSNLRLLKIMPHDGTSTTSRRAFPPVPKAPDEPLELEEIDAPLLSPDTRMPSDFMPLFKDLFESTFWLEASDQARVAALQLWYIAWSRIPTGSLKDNEKWLANQLGCERSGRKWKTLRNVVLWKFRRCKATGLLHHEFLEAKAQEFLDVWAYEADRKRVQRGGAPRSGVLRPRRTPRRGGAGAADTQHDSGSVVASAQHECNADAASVHTAPQQTQLLNDECPVSVSTLIENGNPIGIELEARGANTRAAATSQGWNTASAGALSVTAVGRRRTAMAVDGKLPIDLTWTAPPDFIMEAQSLDLDTEAVVSRFRAYWAEKGNRCTREVWFAKWQNWCREDRKAGRNLVSPGAVSAADLNISDDEE